MRPRPDRGLSGLVAGLGGAHPDDVAAVLARLDPERRDQAQALLAAYAGRELPAEPSRRLAGDAPAPLAAKPAYGTDGLSDWLAQRLRADPSAGASQACGMTPMALAALRASAAELAPLRPSSGAASAASSTARGRRRAPGLRAMLSSLVKRP